MMMFVATTLHTSRRIVGMAKHFDWGRAALDDKVQKYGYEPVSTGFDAR